MIKLHFYNISFNKIIFKILNKQTLKNNKIKFKTLIALFFKNKAFKKILAKDIIKEFH